nr:redoxin family protein [Ardenticatena sp.]
MTDVLHPDRALLRAPELTGGLWLDETPRSLRDVFAHGPLLLDFWDFSCVNCVRTLPYRIAWHERYHPHGLTIVGVHTPEFAFGRDPDVVRRAADDLDIPYPIILDADRTLWYAYTVKAWPTLFLIDQAGRIRYTHVGEGGYAATERAIQALLREKHSNLELPDVLPPLRPGDREGAVCYPTTPELYAGWAHGRLGHAEDWERDVVHHFTDPLGNEEGVLYFQGAWRPTVEYTEFVGEEGHVRFLYRAAELNAVMASRTGEPIRLFILQNGEPLHFADAGEDVIVDADYGSYVLVREPRMYNLVNNPDYGVYEVRLVPAQRGLALYAFSFVPCTRPVPNELDDEVDV